jgi:hypothetical protein
MLGLVSSVLKKRVSWNPAGMGEIKENAGEEPMQDVIQEDQWLIE